MPRQLIFFYLISCLLLPQGLQASEEAGVTSPEEKIEQTLSQLQQPLYSAFVERYVLDELKGLRVELATQKHELMQQILDREHHSVDRAVTYATDSITYFFYLIAGATSILVLVGWTSIRDIKDRVHTLADEEISKLIREYEQRLYTMENTLTQKTLHIDQNREDIERTQDIQSLWMRAGHEHSLASKVAVYDEILKLDSSNCEALTYKADTVLELQEPQWAANLCHQALKIDPQNSHAFYQLACAYTAMQQFDEAVSFLSAALERGENYRDEIIQDPALQALSSYPPFIELINLTAIKPAKVSG